jgi:tetratricopeptide (TPR) repeat protein
VGAAWFFTAFLPISNLFPLNAEVAEHWVYLASIGALLLMAGACVALSPCGQVIALAAAVAAIPALAVRTAIRAGDWVNAEQFCQRTIAAGGASPRVLATLADIYSRRGEVDKQERLLRRMIERFPQFAPARIHLGICLQRQGRDEEAGALLDLGDAAASESARRFPRTWPAALQLARLRAAAGRTDEALAIVREARARFSEAWELAKCEAELLGPGGRSIVENYAAAHWWHRAAWLALGEARVGDSEGALAAFAHAARLDLYDARPHAAIARIELERGRGEAAVAAQCRAIERQPAQADLYLGLATILHELGREAEAAAALRRAQSLGTRLTAAAASGSPPATAPRPGR